MTWVSGFFGIFGLLHLMRLLVPFQLMIGGYEIPLKITVTAGIISLAISAGLLLLEVWRG